MPTSPGKARSKTQSKIRKGGESQTITTKYGGYKIRRQHEPVWSSKGTKRVVAGTRSQPLYQGTRSKNPTRTTRRPRTR